MDESKKEGWKIIFTFFGYLFKGIGKLFSLIFNNMKKDS